MSVTEHCIYHHLNDLYCRKQKAVRTVALADQVFYSERRVRDVLVHLEQRGLVQRRGQRGGWLPVMVL